MKLLIKYNYEFENTTQKQYLFYSYTDGKYDAMSFFI